jgi:hypothetical protein
MISIQQTKNSLTELKGNKRIGLFILIASLLFMLITRHHSPIHMQLILLLFGLYVGTYMFVTDSRVPSSKLLGLLILYGAYYTIFYLFVILSALGLYLIIFTNRSISSIFELSFQKIICIGFVIIGFCVVILGFSLFGMIAESGLGLIVGLIFIVVGLQTAYEGVISMKNNRLPYKHGRRNTIHAANQLTDQKGKRGEKDIAYILNWLDKDKFKVFNDVKLKCNTENTPKESQQFDHIVISSNGIFNIETKNYNGDIEIKQDGSWTRIINGEKRGWESPLFQIQRHRKVLENIIGNNYLIIDIVAIANTHSNVTGQENAPYHIVKADMLQYFIEQYKPENGLTVDVTKSEELIKSSMVDSFIVNNIALTIGIYVAIMLLNMAICPLINYLQVVGFSGFFW